MKQFLLVWMTCLASLSIAQDLGSLAEQINEPKQGAEVTVGGPLVFGAFQIQAAGSTKQLLVGDEPAGLVLTGGSFAFSISDPFSQKVAQRNLKTSGRAKLSGILKKAVIWTYDGLPIQPSGEAAGQPISWLTKVMDDAQFDPPIMDMLQAKLTKTPGVVYALLQVKDSFGDKFYIYKRDPMKTKTEALWILDRLSGNTGIKAANNALLPYRIATQPIARKWWQRFTAPLVAVYENISVDNPEGDRVDIITTTKLQVMEPTNVWRVDLKTNVWSNRNQPRFLRVKSVTVDGAPANYLHYWGELLVQLPKTYQTGELATITVDTGGDIAIHPNGDQYWALGTWAWYPQPQLNGELAMLEMTVRCPKPMQPFASGTRVSLEDQGTHVVLKTQIKKPMQFPVAAAGKWEFYSREQGGKKCNVGTYVIKREKGANRLMNNYFAAAGYYEQLFGTSFPFEEITILEINEWGLGQAPPGIIFLSKEAFEPLGSWANQFFSHGVNERFVHEVAHSWWGHVVKMDSIEEQWITESFASYAAALFLKAAQKKKGKSEFKKTLKHWQGNTRKIKGGGSIYLANYLSFYGDIDAVDRYYLLYNKGPLVLHALRLELAAKYGEEKGDQIFFTLLRSFVTNFQFKWGATAHLIGILNQITQSDWQPWFERYVFGDETPKIKI